MNLFYAPDINDDFFSLNTEESKHIVRVLRMKQGDTIRFTDGRGYFYDCKIIDANPRACQLKVNEKFEGTDHRPFHLQIAIAPTKNINRFEWFLEKATEIGIDWITPLICDHSERKEVNSNRLNRVLVAAMKQSLKSALPILDEAISFSDFITQPINNQKYIAYINEGISTELSKLYQPKQDALVLIGPEGDFSQNEVNLAISEGFKPVKLGPSRLRTETAGVVACHTINLLNHSI